MTDRDCVELLRLLKLYVDDVDVMQGGLEDIKVSELAADLAMSMDVTTDEADYLRREIEVAVT